jgi:DHA1 family tetracycline resistance protein-like MFS transporter
MSTDPPDPSAPPERPKAFGLLFLIVLIDMLGFGLIIPLLPFYALKFNASAFEVTMLLGVYAACQFVATPILGSLSDRVGRRPILVASQLGTAAASLLLGFVTAMHFESAMLGLGLLYLTRVIDGISGGNISAAQAYISDTVHPSQKAKYMGLLGAAFGIAFSIGPGIGGVLGHFNEALPPFLAAALSLVAATLAYLKLPESLKAPIAHAPGWHFMRSARLIREPILGQLVCVWFLAMFAFVITEAVLALYMKDVFGFQELGVGLSFMLAGVIIIIVQGGLIGRLKDAIGEWSIGIIGPIIFTAGMLVYIEVAFVPVVAMLVLAIVLQAVGRSMQAPAMSSLVAHHSPAAQQGAAFGLFHGMGSLARVFGPALAGAIYLVDRTWPPFAVAAVCTVVAGVWMIAIKLQVRRAADPVGIPESA